MIYADTEHYKIQKLMQEGHDLAFLRGKVCTIYCLEGEVSSQCGALAQGVPNGWRADKFLERKDFGHTQLDIYEAAPCSNERTVFWAVRKILRKKGLGSTEATGKANYIIKATTTLAEPPKTERFHSGRVVTLMTPQHKERALEMARNA